MQRSRLLIILSLAVLLMLVVLVSTKKPKNERYELDFALDDFEDFEDFDDDVPLVRVKKDKKAKKKEILALKKKVLEEEVEKDEEADVDKIGGGDNDLTTVTPSSTAPGNVTAVVNSQQVSDGTLGSSIQNGYNSFKKRCGKWCQVAVITGVTLLGVFLVGLIVLGLVMCCVRRTAKHVRSKLVTNL